jgi:hypothetical protein
MRDSKREYLLYTETHIKRRIDELVEYGGNEELWRLYDYLWDNLPVRDVTPVEVEVIN